MKTIGIILWAAAVLLASGLAAAQDEKGWLGTSFAPEKCLLIRSGEFEVRRKLCRITYVIKQGNGVFTIDGLVEFNRKFVPTRPKRIELEVLFIDDQYVCRRQINLAKPVTAQPVRFSVTTPTAAGPQYIRTYYTLYYR